VGPGNVCDFAFRSKYAGDDPDISTLYNFAAGKTMEGDQILFESTKRWFDTLKFDQRIAPTTATGAYISQHRQQLKLGASSFCLGVAISRIRNGNKIPKAIVHGSLVAVAVLFARNHFAKFKKRLNFIDANDVTLLTPIDIDEKVLESNLPECDCGATMDSMPMFGVREPGEALSKGDGSHLKRQRSQTWQNDEIFGSNEFQTTLCYVREFLAKPHPAVGRGGPVCPFVPTSLKKNSIYMSVVRTTALLEGVVVEDKVDAVKEILCKLLKDFIPIFERLEPSEGRLRQFKAVILTFPDVELKLAHEIIDSVQRVVKEDFVERGLMVGEFHACNNASGLR